MSDTPQGPDWWQASDDKWYPPPRPAMPGDAQPVAAAAAAPGPGMPPPGAPPMGPPTGPPTGPPSGGFPARPPSGGFPPPGPTSGAYGAPPGPQAPGGQNRTPLFIAIGVVAAAAVVGLIMLLSGGDDEPDPAVSPTTEETSGGGSDTTADPGGNPPPSGEDVQAGGTEIELVESGFSNFMSGFDNDERSVAYGFIIENAGDETATDISISISAYDAAGTALASDSVTIYVLRPGEKMGVGDEFFGTTFATEVDRIDVQVSEPDNFGRSEVPDEGTLTAEGINTAVSDYTMTTTFTAKSTYAQQIDSPYAYAIYRNDAGEIVGGSYGFLDFIPADGSTAAEITSWEAIPNVASTEVYLDPGWF